MTKILLIPNPVVEDGAPKAYFPIGLTSVATVLRKSGFDAEILDINGIAMDYGYGEIPDAIIERDPDVLGFSTMCDQYPMVVKTARQCRELKPDLQILFGGPQATITSRATIETFLQVDVVVRGECEHTIARVAKAVQKREALHGIPGLTFRDGRRIISTPTPQPIQDLDALPVLDHSLFPAMKSLETIPVEVGRGCPFECVFCSTKDFWQRNFRLRSNENLIKYIKMIVADYGIKKFQFIHDTLTLSRSRTLQLCNALEREGLDIEWTCSSRIDLLDEELISRIAGAGCTAIFFGIETGSERMQAEIKKRLALDRVVKTASQVVNRGMRFLASFIIGFPDERMQDLVQTIRLMMALRIAGGSPDSFQLHLLAPLPGTALMEEYGGNLLLDTTFSDIAGCRLPDEDVHLIKRYPHIFSAFYHYPTLHMERGILVRLPYLILNIMVLYYTTFILWMDKSLQFPMCLLESPLLLDLPNDAGCKIGKPGDLAGVCRLLRDVLYQLGISDHPVHDVIKYELIVHNLKLDDIQKSSGEIHEFAFDIEGLIEDIDSSGLRELPEPFRKMDHSLLFAKNNGKVVTARLPQKLANLLSV